MPLDVGRLRDSDLAATETSEAFRAAVMLWCASWHQVPAASLPDDDRVLSNLAGFGRVITEWRKVRDGALRGWIKCTDGRLYHPVVAEKANASHAEKSRYAHAKLCDRLRKAGIPQNGIPDFDAWISSGKAADFHWKSVLNRPENGGQNHGIPSENPLKGDGEGKREALNTKGATAPLPPAAPAATGSADHDLLGNDLGPHSIPPCPVKQLVELFAARVPELPKPRIELWAQSKGADAMRARWKWLLSANAVREDGSRYATTAAEGVEWFGRFFDSVDESDFLTGRNGAWKKCDLGWLMSRENFMKVVQGNYSN